MLRKIIFTVAVIFCSTNLLAQSSPCTDSKCRAFDFWVGSWEVFGKNGKKAGDSKISLILDSCVVLEEWTSASSQSGVIYKGKSFNTYNSATHQWQQTWVDNTGGTTEYLRSEVSSGQITFYADKVISQNGKSFLRRLTFTQLSAIMVRQLGERSDDDGKTWSIEYDLEYHRK